MLILFLILSLASFDLSWSFDGYSKQPIKLTQKDYSKYIISASNLPRSKEIADAFNINFVDIFVEMEDLAEDENPQVDFGSGTPNFLPAQTILDSLINQSNIASSIDIHQYPRTRGDLRLVTVAAKFWSYLLKRNINPLREVLITVGSMNALELVARSYLDKGDEIIIFEPFFAFYPNMLKLPGAKMITVPFRIRNGTTGESSNDWTFDKMELESKINKRTKLIWLNNPNNPLGKVFTLNELTFIGYLAKKYDLIIMSDEAAQWYIMDSPEHIRIASLPGLFERTITINSGGKMFSNTGWRIGIVIAPEPLLWPMVVLTESSTSNTATSMQIAFAIGLETELKRWGTPQSYFIQLRQVARGARNRLVSILKSVGADVIVPTAGYVVHANFTKLANQIDLSSYNDNRPGIRFWKYMLYNGSINTYPLSLFYSEKNMWKTEYCLRFTHLKTLQTMDKLESLLSRLFKRVPDSEYDFDAE